MLERKFYSSCPCCGYEDLQRIFYAVDATVSNERFEIWECNACALRFTQDIPTQEHIGSYYKSDSYISHTDTRSGWVNKLYHLARSITLKRKKNLLYAGNVSQTRNLLDIGAGTGAFCAYMKQQGWMVTGIEPDTETRHRAIELNHIQLLEPESFYALPMGTYDAITMWHVLEHVHDLHGYMKHIRALLKPGGKLYIAVPNYTSFDARHYKSSWAAYDVPRHLYHFSPKSMRQLIRLHEMRLLEMKPMWFDSFYISMLSEKICGSKSPFLKGLWVGVLSSIATLLNHKRSSSLIYVISVV